MNDSGNDSGAYLTEESDRLAPAHSIAYRLPLPGWPRAVLEADARFDRVRLLVEGQVVAESHERKKLERGVQVALPGLDTPLVMQRTDDAGAPMVDLRVGERSAPLESRLRAPPSRAAWIHACLALLGSFAGFMTGYLYFQKAETLELAWANKMAIHTIGWHLLLVFTLFPTSVWGQRLGIRTVQVVSSIFFFIHLGMAAANLGPGDPQNPSDPAIAVWNALSGLLFLASTVYGSWAWRSMDPIRALPAMGPEAQPVEPPPPQPQP